MLNFDYANPTRIVFGEGSIARLDELVADTLDDWIATSVRLIDEPEFLDRMTRRVKEADLDRDLFRVSDAQCLRRAFDELIRHDARFKQDGSRKPIWIG